MNGVRFTLLAATLVVVCCALQRAVALPTVSVVATDDYASEMSPPGITNTGLFTLTRTGETTEALVVQFTFGGTAVPVEDYLSQPAEVTFPAGAATVSITIVAVYSRDAEPTESVILTLATNAVYVVGSVGEAIVNIWKRDYDDPALPPVVVFTDGSGAEQVYPGGYVNTVSYTIYRGGPIHTPLAVDYQLGGTAFPGVDYTGLLSGVATIPAGSDRISFQMTPIDDAVAEGYESIIVSLLPKTNYVLGSRSEAVAEVFDNDPGSIPTINQAWWCATEEACSFKVNGRPGQAFLVYCSTNLVDWSAVGTNPIPAGAHCELPGSGTTGCLYFCAEPQ